MSCPRADAVLQPFRIGPVLKNLPLFQIYELVMKRFQSFHVMTRLLSKPRTRKGLHALAEAARRARSNKAFQTLIIIQKSISDPHTWWAFAHVKCGVLQYPTARAKQGNFSVPCHFPSNPKGEARELFSPLSPSCHVLLDCSTKRNLQCRKCRLFVEARCEGVDKQHTISV